MKSKPRRGAPQHAQHAGAQIGTTQTLQDFEQLVAELSQPRYVFHLYIAGASVRSSLAITNIRKICEQYLLGRYELDVIDIYQQPETTTKAQVVAVPTLIKEFPMPPQRFVGDLSDTEKIVVSLKLRE